MWIMLIKKPPTRPSPPKMSIFWSVAWPDDHYARTQDQECCLCGSKIMYNKYGNESYCDCPRGWEPHPYTEEDVFGFDHTGFGATHNWVGARKIHYLGHDIRVFPDEFTAVKKENMRLYVLGDSDVPEESNSHIFVADSVAVEREIKAILDGETRPLYDAALNDGCTHEQALMVAMGMNITLPDENFPPIGWYKIRPEYGEIYCEPWELEETTEVEEDISVAGEKEE